MKYALMIMALLAIIGVTAAWEDTTVFQTQLQRDFYMQAGDPSSYIVGTTSGGGFSISDPLGGGMGLAVMGVTAADGTTAPWLEAKYGDDAVSETVSVTQGSQIVLANRALDSQDNAPEIYAGVTTTQNLHFSGAYTDVSASFQDFATTGVEGCWNGVEQYTSGEAGSVTANDGLFKEADVGEKSWTVGQFDLIQDQAEMSGGTQSWASFTRASDPDDGDVSISTSTGGITTVHSLENTYPDMTPDTTPTIPEITPSIP